MLSPTFTAWSRDQSAELSKLTLPSLRPKSMDAPRSPKRSSQETRPATAPHQTRRSVAQRAARKLLRHFYVAACSAPLPHGLVATADAGSCAASQGSEDELPSPSPPRPRTSKSPERSPGDPYRMPLRLAPSPKPANPSPRKRQPQALRRISGAADPPDYEVAFRSLVPAQGAPSWPAAAAATANWLTKPAAPSSGSRRSSRWSQ